MIKILIQRMIVLTTLVGAHIATAEDRVFFESGLLAFADGKSYGVNADHIGMTLQLIHELGKMLDGEKTATDHVGMFTFQGVQHTTRSLHKLESEYDIEWCEIQTMRIDQNNAAAVKAKKQREQEFIQKKALLRSKIEEIKKHFEVKVAPFMNYARGMRDIIQDLILESCLKRNRADSFMLTWNKVEEGKETELLQKEMTSCKALNLFILDLYNFLKDFVHSCPKARAQFMELVKQKRHKE